MIVFAINRHGRMEKLIVLNELYHSCKKSNRLKMMLTSCKNDIT
jgi:hypothetical protein